MYTYFKKTPEQVKQLLLIIMIYTYKDFPFGSQGKAQRRINAVHVMDALVLNGTDVRHKHFNQR